MADIEVKLRLTADGSVLVSNVETSEEAIRDLGDTAQSSGAKANQGFNVAAQGSANLKGEMREARGAAVELAAAVGGLAVIKGLATDFLRYADIQGQVDARLRRVSESTEEQAQVTARLQRIAHDAYVDVNDVVETYVRSIEPMRQLGHTTGSTLDLTEALSLSMVVSASATDKRALAIEALSKVTQTGIVKMEQFEQLLNGSPRFVQALEESLGKTRAELLGMVQAGSLTVDELARVSSEIQTLRDEVEDMPTTLEDASIRFRNAFQSWTGEANQAHGVTQLLVSGIEVLANNMDGVMLVALVASTAALGVATTAGVAWTAGLFEQARAAGLQAVATLEARQASQALMQQQVLLTLNAQRLTRVDLARAEASLAVALADQAAARAAGLRATSEIAMARASAALTAADIAQTAALTSLNAARTASVGANAAVAAAQMQHATAIRATSSAATALSPRLLTMGNALNALVSLAIGYEIGTWARQFEAVRIAGDYLVGGLMVGMETIKAGVQIAAAYFEAVWTGSINTVKGLIAELAGISAEVYDVLSYTPTGMLLGAEDAANKMRALQAELAPTESAYDKLAKSVGGTVASWLEAASAIRANVSDMEDARAADEAAAAAAEEYGRTGVIAAKSVDAALSALRTTLQQQNGQLQEQVATYGKGREAAVEYAQGIELAKAATIADTDARETYIAGVRATFAPLIANARALDVLQKSQKGATDAQRKFDDAKKAADKRLADSAKFLAAAAAEEAAYYTKAQQARQGNIALHAQQRADIEQEINLFGLSAAARERELILIEASRLARDEHGQVIEEERLKYEALLTTLSSQQLADGILGDFEGPIDRLVSRIEEVRAALETATDPALIARLQAAMSVLNDQLQGETIGSYKALLGAVQTFASEGSRSFQAIETGMAALSIVQDIIALKAAVTAVLTQGQGEPYSAFARMAAMAAAVAPFLASIGMTLSGMGGGGFSGGAEQQQATQGTGSVLGDAEAKSESILNALNITADATSKLVGINTGMLRALQYLQGSIAGASGQLARGAGQVEYGAFDPGFILNARNGAAMGAVIGSIIPVIGTAIGAVLGFVLGGLLGGSSRVSDEGISIGGGNLDQLDFNAYQERQTRSWRFGSTRTNTDFAPLADEFASQFQLIVDSLTDTVREGALALGLLPADIQAALDEFQLATIRISLKDLTAEEQQAELAAVFSQIFDNLAGSVVPFIGQFQRVGEGLGETLVRVATGVQVTQEALARLGFALDETDPERFAQASEALIELVGGIEEFISGMSNFVENFASEEHKFNVLASDLNRGFAQAGLAVPMTRDAMWDLMQSLDATTVEGREQIATLLRLSATADAYYTQLERRAAEAERAAQRAADEAAEAAERAADAERELIDARTAGITALEEMMAGIRKENADLSDFARQWIDAGDWRTRAIAAAAAHAQAAGLAAARESDLADIELRAAQIRAEAIAQLQESIASMAVELGYSDAPDTLDYLNRRIGELSDASGAAASGISNAVATIIGELDLLLGNLSPFNDRQKLEIARGGLQNGSVTQEQFLTIAQRLFGGTARFFQEFNFAQGFPGAASSPGNSGSAGTPRVTSTDTRSLEELTAIRDALLAEQRIDRAQDFARRVAELNAASGDSFADIAAKGNFTLEQLADDLGLSNEQLIEYLTGLSARFSTDVQMNSAKYLADRITSETSRIVDAITNPFNREGSLVTLPLNGVRPELGAAGVSVPDDLDVSPEVGNGKPIFNAAPIITNAGLSTADPTTSEVAALRATVEAQSAELVAIRTALERIAGSAERSAEADETTAGATTATADSLDRLRRDRPLASRSDRASGAIA